MSEPHHFDGAEPPCESPEAAWDFNHEDAPGVFHFSGVNYTQENGMKQHGTAVMGGIAAAEKGLHVS